MLGHHLTLAFGIADVKAYLGLQRSDNLNPIYISIWSAFAECGPESPGLAHTLYLCKIEKIDKITKLRKLTKLQNWDDSIQLNLNEPGLLWF